MSHDSSRSKWSRRQVFCLSRTVICLVLLLSLGSLFIPVSGIAARVFDMLLRTYLIFIGAVMAHESVHGHLAATRAGNYWWGRIALLPSMVPFTNFRRTHQLHHAFTNIPDKDPDHFMKSRNLLELALKAIAMPHHWFFWLRSRRRFKRADIVELVLNYTAIALLHGLILTLVGTERFFWGIAPPLALVSFMLWYPFAVQTHEGFSTGSPESRSHNYYGHVMFWFSLGLSMHREHHLKPKLAWIELLPFVEEPKDTTLLFWPRRDIRPDTSRV
ncbi:MAG TPA: fatty acid desaturase [Pyrinomonadaceae bacterium]